MAAHAQYCHKGDHTLEATDLAIKDVVKVPADEYFVFVVSDADLARYGITAAAWNKILMQNRQVHRNVCVYIYIYVEGALRPVIAAPILLAMDVSYAFILYQYSYIYIYYSCLGSRYLGSRACPGTAVSADRGPCAPRPAGRSHRLDMATRCTIRWTSLSSC